MEQYDAAIIGAGPSGMTAAIYAARADMKVLLLDRLAPGGQIINTNEIENFTGAGSINGAELAYKMYEHTQRFENITFDYRTVLRVEDQGELKRVICEEDDKEYGVKAVILATGTRPRCLEVPGEEKFRGKSISWCAICDGARYRGKDVVVIGGGNSAVQESIFLSGIVNRLTIVTMLDLTADPMACDRLRAMKNVTVYPYQDVLEFTGETKLEGVRFRSAKTGEERAAACDGVFEYIGLTPTTEAFRDLGVLDKMGYVEVNSRMETAVPGIYGAGDCVTKELRQVITACADGAIAAQESSHYIQRL